MRNENDSNLDLSLENEQRVYCNSYDELVRGLAKKMEVDKVKLFPTEEENFDFEDIQGWIGLVDFQNREVPDIMVNLSADKGMNVFRFNVKDVKPIEDKDEKETKEQWITRTAITDAKMKVIEGVAEDVYPAVAFQIAEYRKEIANIRDEILHNKNERLSFEDILEALPSLPSSKRSMMGLATTAVVASMILAACSNPTSTTAYEKATATQPVITEVSPTVEVTAAPTLTPTTEPTSTPSATPTAEASPTPEFPTYEECVGINYNLPFDKDIYGHERPTTYVESEEFGPTTQALVVGCLPDSEGKVTDPEDVVNGYETTVTFYDKYGEPHTYRLITGGETLNTKEFKGRDDLFVAERFDFEKPLWTRKEFQILISNFFHENRSKEMLMYLYIKGGEGLSPFYDRIAKNAEIYEQIVEAIKTGEGFPDNLPEDFFLFSSAFEGEVPR